MKRQMVSVVIACVLCLAPLSHALVIEAIQIAQANGVKATYENGVLEWTGGVSGSVITGGMKYVIFDAATVTATFSNVTDLTAANGGVATATFDTCTNLVVSLKYGGTERLRLEGGMVGDYDETETYIDSDALDGRMIARLTSMPVIDEAFFKGWFRNHFGGVEPDQVVWGDGDDLVGVGSTTVFNNGWSLPNYGTDYESTNVTITVHADESAIPEPATMILLGLGSLLTLKRRKV